MKSFKIFPFSLSVILALQLSLPACVDLEETLYSEIVPDTYVTGQEQLNSIVASTYVWFRLAATDRKWYSASELAADQIVGVAKDNGAGSYDGGRQVELHWHKYSQTNECLESAWDVWTKLIAGSNLNIDIFQEADYEMIGLTEADRKRHIAEAMMLRAIGFFELMDMFGNIPAPEDIYVDLPEQRTPQQVFEMIDRDIKEYTQYLPKGWNASTYGRITQAAAKMLQMRLYFNAANYGMPEHWTECRDICRSIINGEYGNYELAKTFYEPFDWNNDTSKEIVLGVSMDETLTGRPEIFYTWNHRGARDFYGLGYRGNNQLGLSPSKDPAGNDYNFQHKLGTPFKHYDKKDLRVSEPANPDKANGGGMFLYGEMKSKLGSAKGEKEYNKQVISLVDQVARFASGKDPAQLESTVMHGEENSCYRWNRYRIYASAEVSKYFKYDYVWMRLSEVYYTLAECMLRLGEAGYSQWVNQVKKRNFNEGDFVPYTDATLDLDELLCDRGREFIGESLRRRDLIRYGYFNLPWWDKDASSPLKKIFPIPPKALFSNTKLVQNEGYSSASGIEE
ncbi:MAG: RagB/SusD family nutrient uptake outer membrane protein [Dysgonamonadaceae bacterium]|jgi:hypothetical protein|nr:RagB/SusD family nutrient uptake outer membrane protein [Dysgonamonadaceae bacterium]